MAARVTRSLSMLSAVFIALATVTLLPASASGAAIPARPYGRIGTTVQHRDGTISVTGWVYDRTHSGKSITGCLAVHAKCVRGVHADRSSRDFDTHHHISGRHAFALRVPAQQPGVNLELRSYAGRWSHLDSQRVATVGARVIRLAKRFVGNTRYVDGGSTPKQGFDCSGYTRWIYAHAHVANLPHNAEAQRHVSHMHRIPRSKARPGDLVFYFGGGAAYHVAIYAGHGKQYAAATPQDGIRYQNVWSSDVEYRTDWH